MIPALILLSQNVDAIDWQPSLDLTLKKAEDNRRLAMVLFQATDDPLSIKLTNEVCSDSRVIKSSKRFVSFRSELKATQTTSRGYAVSSTPILYFVDSDGNVQGHLLGLFDPDFFVKWSDAVGDVWKKHDSLVFRSRGRLSDRDSGRLAFSYALRLETEKAKSLLAVLPGNLRLEEIEYAWIALAQAYTIKRDEASAVDSWARLEALSRSPEFRGLAKYGMAVLWMPTRPKDALAKFKEVDGMAEVPAMTKWCAEYQMKLLEKD